MTTAKEDTAPPVLVEVLRGGAVESRHRGSFAVVDAAGRIVSSTGPIEVPVFPRSAVKPIQALPLVESGAAEALHLSQREIALACASHLGEPIHVNAVRSWLAAAGLDARALECGAHPPLGDAATAELVHRGMAPSPLHNNCSGKHAGFLCTAVHLGEDPRGYIRADHPVQKRVTAALTEMTGADLMAAPCGCDGCGIPTYAIPLRAIARGMARMVDTASLGPGRARAAAVVLDAMAAEPFFVGGTASFVTQCMTVAGATVRLKVGAEGVYAAALPRHGYGIALKIEDGGTRAAELAMASLLRRLGCFSEEQRHALDTYLHPVVRNVSGREVGLMRVTAAVS
jgi:L-asparaginase II